MRVLFLGLNYAPEPIGIAVYSTGLCERLVAEGHEVRAVTAKPYYPQWRLAEGFGGGWRRTAENGVDLTRCPLYVPARPSGVRRILHHISFGLSALFPMVAAARHFRPDVVMTVAPSLVAAPVAKLAARLAAARAWLHVQDFEVEAAVATGLLDSRSRLTRLASRIERMIVGRFDRISSISPEMCAKLLTFGIEADRIVEFRNWADVDRVTPLDRPSSFRAEWGVDRPHVALYSGNIANKQGIDIVLEAARRLRYRSDLLFIVCGEGPNRASLEAQARDLDNIRFHDLQPAERLGELLGLASVHLLPQKADAADLVLPSKLVNMLASGRPVVATAAAGTGLAREVQGCGWATPPGDASAFAAAIERLIDDPAAHHACSVAARRRAEEVWHRDRIIDRLITQLARSIDKSSPSL